MQEQSRSFKPLAALGAVIVLVGALSFLLASFSPRPVADAAPAPRAHVAGPRHGAQAKLERWLTVHVAYPECVRREDQPPHNYACYDAKSACWWRNSPYWNFKCWVTFHLRSSDWQEHLPWAWIFCTTAAWGDQFGRKSRVQRGWRCDESRNGPPDYAAADRP